MTASIKTIQTGLSALGIKDDDDKKALYLRVVNVDGLRKMNGQQLDAVMTEVRRLGFQPKPGGKRSPANTLSGPKAGIIRAFWLSGYNLGVFRNPDDRAILDFAKDQAKVDHVHWFDEKASRAVIEAIKAIVRRETNMPDLWKTQSKLHDWLNLPGVQVVLAQWELLKQMNAAPADSSRAWKENPKKLPGVDACQSADLVALQKKLGELVRKAKKARA